MNIALVGAPDSGKRNYFSQLVSGTHTATMQLAKHPMLATLEHSLRECLFYLVDVNCESPEAFDKTMLNARGCIIFLDTKDPEWVLRAHSHARAVRAVAEIPIAFVECVRSPATSRLTPMDILDLLHTFGQDITSCMILTFPQTL
jgi:hypothetical protein